MRSQPRKATVDGRVGEVAGRQYGVISRPQLRLLGLSASGIQRRLEKGSLLPVHRGVYRVGHAAPSIYATYLAAVLACGPGALLGGRAAAFVHRLTKGAPPPPEVLVPTDRRVPGVLIRRIDASADAGRSHGIPITKVARTLVDLAAVHDGEALARAVHEAQVLHGVRAPDVERVLGRRPNSHGAAKLRNVLWGDTAVTMSPLERRFIRVLGDASLPSPTTNAPAGGRYVDCRWPAHRLTVELDGYRFHGSRHAWERDRLREREAYARGDQFRRYSYDDVFERPRLVVRELEVLLLPR
jgi:very-short-patch-repair endonuclease